MIALIVGLAFIAFQMLTAFGVTEQKRRDDADSLSLKDMFGLFKRNDQLVYAGIASLLLNIGMNLLIIFGVNFFYVEFGYSKSGNLVLIFTVMYGLGTLISQALYASIMKRRTRHQVLTFSTAAIVVLYLLFLSVGYLLPKNIVLIHVIGFFIFFFQGLLNLIVIVMINNTIEYDEVRFHERHDSVISAVRSFSVKLAGGINQGLSTLVLILSGIYATSQKISALEIEADQGTITSKEVLSSANTYLSAVLPSQRFVLRLGMALIPIVSICGMALLLRKKYRIDEQEYDRLVKQLEG